MKEASIFMSFLTFFLTSMSSQAHAGCDSLKGKSSYRTCSGYEAYIVNGGCDSVIGSKRHSICSGLQAYVKKGDCDSVKGSMAYRTCSAVQAYADNDGCVSVMGSKSYSICSGLQAYAKNGDCDSVRGSIAYRTCSATRELPKVLDLLRNSDDKPSVGNNFRNQIKDIDKPNKDKGTRASGSAVIIENN